MAAQARAHTLRSVWHPAPEHALIHTDHGNLRVLAGTRRGQLSSGAFIDI